MSALTLGLTSTCLAQERAGRTEDEAAAGKAITDGKITLQKAVTEAEAVGKGAAISAMVRGAKEDWKINVQVWSGDKRISVPVDLKTGKPGEPTAAKVDAPGVDRDKKLAEALKASKTSLGDAIAAAESHSKGKAFRAIAMDERENLMIHVSCWVDGKTMLCRVNAKTKEVTEEKGREERREERKAERDKNRKDRKGEGAPPAKP